jgi:hypothetical protein
LCAAIAERERQISPENETPCFRGDLSHHACRSKMRRGFGATIAKHDLKKKKGSTVSRAALS